MLLIHKIEKTHFSPSEAQIIQYILDKGLEIKNMSVASIANATYTSSPLLIRIAKKLGFTGWNEFKEEYLNELEYLYQTSEIDASIPFVVSDDFMTISHNIAQLQMETIQDTMNLIDHDSLYRAMRYLRKCEIVDVYGISNNLILAQEFAEKMFYIHKNAYVCHLNGDNKLQAIMSDEKHCAILISYSGQTPSILEVVKILKKKKTPIIAITSIGDNDLSKQADVVLRISSREMLHTKIGNFASTQSVKLILDILYGCIFSFDYQRNLDEKISFAKEVDDRHSGFEYIDEDKYY